LESELFGHERGAFSGATEARPGKFELAHRGTLFLDEIGDMPIILQSKILRVLQERELYRLGALSPRRIDVRIIAATNQALEGMLQSGRFREDLYYRLNVVRITLPPLRERGEDIPLLANRFLHRQRDAQGPRRFSEAAHQALLDYAWPGNVRELENVVAQAILRARGPVIGVEDLAVSESRVRSTTNTQEAAPVTPFGAGLETLFDQHAGNVFAVAEQLLVGKALELARHNQVQAARLLGVSRNVLRDRMKRYSLS
jgi:sigma-54-specific transcriptional regulator